MQIIQYIITLVVSWFNRRKADDKPKFTPPPVDIAQAPALPDESKLIIRYDVTQKWHKGWARDLKDITEVCIHHTESNTMDIDQWINYILNPEPARIKRQKEAEGLFPFLIGFTGQIVKFGPLSRWWWASSSDKHDAQVVNIEICQGNKEFKDVQIDSLCWLIFDYILYHCPNMRRIVGHDFNNNLYSGSRKGCPGNLFPWARLEQEMNTRGITFTNTKIECYDLIVPGDGI